jgi:hypothetical protein
MYFHKICKKPKIRSLFPKNNRILLEIEEIEKKEKILPLT